MSFCECLPKLEVVTEVSKFSNLSDNEVDYNLPILSSCKYYSVNEVQKLKNKDNFNIFHTNINGLESKFDNLFEFISSTTSEFDVIAITETSQKMMYYLQQMFLLKDMKSFTLLQLLAREAQRFMLKKNMMCLNVLILNLFKMIVLKVCGWKLKIKVKKIY